MDYCEDGGTASFRIYDDTGSLRFCLRDSCPHLHYANWEICNENQLNLNQINALRLNEVESRVKELENKQKHSALKQPWPQEGDWYFYFDERGTIHSTTWANHSLDMTRKAFLGVYPTLEAASQARTRIAKFATGGAI